MDRGAWRAAVHGVAQSQTQLKWLCMHVCIGEGNGNPLQCSCLENPRDGGAWWAAVYGVTESDTTEVTLHACMHWRGKWQPTPVFLPGESQGRGSLVGGRLWGHRVGHDWSNLAAAAGAELKIHMQSSKKKKNNPNFILIIWTMAEELYKAKRCLIPNSTRFPSPIV